MGQARYHRVLRLGADAMAAVAPESQPEAGGQAPSPAAAAPSAGGPAHARSRRPCSSGNGWRALPPTALPHWPPASPQCACSGWLEGLACEHARRRGWRSHVAW